jgi:hypothetical protein
MKHFNHYLKEAVEKTLKTLLNNFKKVHPYSNINLQISSVKVNTSRFEFIMFSYM